MNKRCEDERPLRGPCPAERVIGATLDLVWPINAAVRLSDTGSASRGQEPAKKNWVEMNSNPLYLSPSQPSTPRTSGGADYIAAVRPPSPERPRQPSPKVGTPPPPPPSPPVFLVARKADTSAFFALSELTVGVILGGGCGDVTGARLTVKRGGVVEG